MAAGVNCRETATRGPFDPPSSIQTDTPCSDLSRCPLLVEFAIATLWTRPLPLALGHLI